MVGEGTMRASKGGKQTPVLTSFDAMKHMKHQHDMIVLRVLEWMLPLAETNISLTRFGTLSERKKQCLAVKT